MKMIIILSLVLFTGIFGCTPSGSDSGKAWGKKIGETMCSKIVECVKVQLKSMSAKKRKMAAAYMPTKEKCLEGMNKEFRSKKNKEKDIKMTANEIKLARACLKAIEAMKCGAKGMKRFAGCEKWSKAMSSRDK